MKFCYYCGKEFGTVPLVTKDGTVFCSGSCFVAIQKIHEELSTEAGDCPGPGYVFLQEIGKKSRWVKETEI